MVTSTVLGAMKFLDFLCRRYDFTPPNLQIKYDGCSSSFSVRHILICSNGGLLIARNNKLREEILYLSKCALPFSCIRGKPLIHQGYII